MKGGTCYLLIVFGDVDPVMRGPFKTPEARDAAARRHRRKHGKDDGLYKAGTTEAGRPFVLPYGAGELPQ